MTWFLLFATALWPGQAGGAPVAHRPMVTVRVIDARDGKPYANLPVFVTLYKWKLKPGDPRFGSLADVDTHFKRTTDARGEIRFSLPPPTAPQMAAEPGGPFACGGTLFNTETILKSGVVGENRCKGKLRKSRIRFQAKPGEVVVFARPFSFWDGLFDRI
jgi:hypothetical protein